MVTVSLPSGIPLSGRVMVYVTESFAVSFLGSAWVNFAVPPLMLRLKTELSIAVLPSIVPKIFSLKVTSTVSLSSESHNLVMIGAFLSFKITLDLA